MSLSEIVSTDEHMEMFNSDSSSCYNCEHFHSDIHISGQQYWFCNLLEIAEKDLKLCLLYELTHLKSKNKK